MPNPYELQFQTVEYQLRQCFDDMERPIRPEEQVYLLDVMRLTFEASQTAAHIYDTSVVELIKSPFLDAQVRML